MSLTTFEASTVHRMSNELQSSQDGAGGTSEVAPKCEVSVQQQVCRTLEPRAFFLEFGRSMCIPAGRLLVLHVPQTIDDRHGFKFPNRFPAWHIITLLQYQSSCHYMTVPSPEEPVTVYSIRITNSQGLNRSLHYWLRVCVCVCAKCFRPQRFLVQTELT